MTLQDLESQRERYGVVDRLWDAQAAKTPQAIAAEYAGSTLTYAELNERANRFAAALQVRGVEKESIVGIGLQRSLDLPVALLGVLKAGAVCMPLDPEYPTQRLAFMIEDARANLLVTENATESRYEGCHAATIRVCTEDNHRHPAAREGTAADAAWIVYTSGSTGQPKGVVLTHGGLVNHHLAAIELYGVRPGDRVLQFSSLSFDIAIEEMFPSWLAGATVVFRDNHLSLAPEDFLRWIAQKQISVLDLPTAYWHELVHGLADRGQALPQCLRLVIVGGEKASASALRAWTKLTQGRIRWINTYGPSEATIIATSWEPRSGEAIPDSDLPIGKAIAGVQAYVLGPDGALLPAGVPGELHIGGAGIARGYLHRPSQTEDKFVADPFSREPGARLYKTGDLACFRPDGNLEFRGRRDRQVKIGGFRVELEEIEAALAEFPGVREAAVSAQGESEKILAAWIVPLANESFSARELRDFLKTKLPVYMLPSVFHRAHSVPLTPNGKVDRRALELIEDRIPHDREAAAPSDEMERSIVAMMEEVLKVKPIAVNENFFDLGGNSLLAIRLMTRIQETFGRTLPLAILFRSSSAAALASVLRQADAGPVTASLIPVRPAGHRPPFFLVHGMGGHVLRFQALIRHFPEGQPVYALQARGLSGECPCLNRVEDMARAYLDEIREFQPHGPYYLGGYSFGGLVALEMARSLEAAGEEVAYLGLIDTFIGAPASKGALVSRLIQLSPRDQFEWITRKVRKKLRRVAANVALPAPVKAVRQGCAEAEAGYKPGVYAGRIHLYLPAQRSLRSSHNADEEWADFALGGVEVHATPGDHGSIVDEPNAARLASAIAEGLKKARASTREIVTQ